MSDAAPIRLGVVGCGDIAQVMHLPLAHDLPEFTISAVCDISPKVVEAVGERYAVTDRFVDYNELMASDVEAVIIATFDHVAPASAALDAKKHVLIEKPLALDPKEARGLERDASAAGVVAMMGYMKRYDPGYAYGVERIQALDHVRLGRVHDFSGRFDKHVGLYGVTVADDLPDDVKRAGDERTQQAVEAALGDAVQHTDLYMAVLMLASHDLSIMRGAFGEPAAVQWSSALDSTTMVALIDCDRAPVVLEMSEEPLYEWWDERLSAYGDHEIVEIEFPNPYFRYAPTTVHRRRAEGSAPMSETIPVSSDEAFRRELQHFAKCIRGGASPLTPLGDGAADVELAVELVRSVDQR